MDTALKLLGFIIAEALGFIILVLKVFAPVNLFNSLFFWAFFGFQLYYNCHISLGLSSGGIGCKDTIILESLVKNDFLEFYFIMNLLSRFMGGIGFVLDILAIGYLVKLIKLSMQKRHAREGGYPK